MPVGQNCSNFVFRLGFSNLAMFSTAQSGFKEGKMNKHAERFLFWTPRFICILFAVFLSLFSLDVFSEGYSFWKTILALLIHLVPVYICIIVLIIAWRRELIGTILFIALAIFYWVLIWGRGAPLSAYLLIPGPLIFIGVLFLLNWLYKEKMRT